MAVTILRMGHRLHRDFRITTHCALVARAFGASGMIYSGDKDDDIVKTMEKVNQSWGGEFRIEYRRDWAKVIEEWMKRGGYTVLATMYGTNLPEVSSLLRKETNARDILLIVGSEKLPGRVFHTANLNVAVTNQPHSEVASIALILDRIKSGKELGMTFQGGKYKIVPKEKGKMMREREED